MRIYTISTFDNHYNTHIFYYQYEKTKTVSFSVEGMMCNHCKANVEKADYLSRMPLMDTSKISPENRELFQRVKYNYAKAWSLQSVITLKRKSLKNFSPLSPVRMIATRMEIIVLSAVARLIEEGRAEQIINTVFEVNEDKHGRVRIPDILVEFAGLDKDIVTVGMGNKLSIMTKELRESKRSKRTHAQNMDILNKKLKG